MSKSVLLISSLARLVFVGLEIGLERRRINKAKLIGMAAIVSTLGLILPIVDRDAHASGSDFKRHVYVGMNAGMSRLSPDASRVDATVDDKNDLAYGLTLGMDVSNRFSAEFHANDLGAAKLAPNGEVDYQIYGLSALYYGLNYDESRQLREDFSGYLRLGIGSMSNSADIPFERENDFNVVLGLGTEYGMRNGLAFRGEITRFYSDAYYAGLGVLYRFDKNNSRVNEQRAIESEVTAPLIDEQITEEPSPPLIEAEPQITMIDNDADGVSDDVDKCLDSRPQAPVNTVGCALFDGVLEGVSFEPASATLTRKAEHVLNSTAKDLLHYSTIKVAILAHTDNQGDAKLNLELSKKRAIAVVRYLLARGVPLNRMQAEAYGERRPIASNETTEGRLRNRRVEFKILHR